MSSACCFTPLCNTNKTGKIVVLAETSINTSCTGRGGKVRKNDPNDTILRNVKQIGCPLHTSTNKALVNRNRISLDRRHTVVVGVTFQEKSTFSRDFAKVLISHLKVVRQLLVC